MPQDFWVGVDSGTIHSGTINQVGTILGIGGTLSTSPSGTLPVEQQFSYFNTTSNGTTVIKSGAGFVHNLTVNTLSILGQSILYDNTASSGTKLATINTTISNNPYLYNAKFTNGLTLVNTGGGDVTISYR